MDEKQKRTFWLLSSAAIGAFLYGVLFATLHFLIVRIVDLPDPVSTWVVAALAGCLGATVGLRQAVEDEAA